MQHKAGAADRGGWVGYAGLSSLEDFPLSAVFATFQPISDTFAAKIYKYMSDKKDGQKTALFSIFIHPLRTYCIYTAFVPLFLVLNSSKLEKDVKS